MDKIWEIAKRIHDYNENCSITGTLMLKIRGIDLGREPKDVDILICDYAPNIKFPPDMKAKQIGQASDGSGAKYQYDGVIIDVLSDGEEPEIIDGWRLGTLKKLLGVKYEYSKQANEDAQKHYNDLIKLGYDFPKTTNERLDLPF